MAISRAAHVAAIDQLLRWNPVVALLGARQVGKTTLARQIAASRPNATYFDLEQVEKVRPLLDEPLLTLEPLRGLVVIDEIQNRPELFPLLRGLADRPRRPARFLVLGSAAPELLRQSSETLAGRIAFHELPGFSLSEVGPSKLDRLWWRGGFPRAFLARTLAEAANWQTSFARTFVEREILPLGVGASATTVQRFWTMLAHLHGQTWNASELGRAFGVAHTTVERYVDALVGTFVVDRLPPWFENIGKRLVQAPKIYIADTGQLHSLLGIPSVADLRLHPKVGASWEGFMLGELRKHLGADRRECFFWATHGGAELDLLVVRGQKRRGFEIKRTSAPRVTPSMRNALVDLKLDHIDVIHAGERTYAIAQNIRAVAARDMLDVVDPL